MKLNQFINQVHEQIANLVPYQGGMSASSLKNVSQEAIIKLASNENPLGPSPKAQAAMLVQLNQCHLYPETMQETLEALAEHLTVAPSQLILGNGSENIIAMLIQAFNRPENHFLIPQYGFSAYAINAKAHNANVKIIPTPNYQLTVERILTLANEQTAMIFIDNPGNPTGAYLSHEKIKTLLTQLSPKTLLVLDEAYYEYAQETQDYPNSLSLQKKYPNLIVLRTFSKIYGLAGLRIGYGIAHEDIICLLNRIRFPFNVASLSLVGAMAALKDVGFVSESLALNKKGLADYQACFHALKLAILPSIGNFITIDLKSDVTPFFNFMLKQGIILRPLAAYQLPNHLRISIGNETQNALAIEKIKQFWKEKI